jgi:hypothetical protein
VGIGAAGLAEEDRERSHFVGPTTTARRGWV